MVYPIIVTYNPDLKVLRQQFDALKTQVDGIFYIDNGSGNQKELIGFIENEAKKELPTAELYLNEKNLGLGAAQNQGISSATGRGIDHVVFFDQDSIPDSSFIKTMLDTEESLLSKGISVGTLSPKAIEEDTGKICPVIEKDGWKRRYIIPQNGEYPVLCTMSSGSLIRTEVFKTVGTMNGHLFVDVIDNEWCIRAKAKGYENFVTSKAIIKHKVGDSIIKVLGKSMHMHAPYRLYYNARNNLVQVYNPAYKGLRSILLTKTFAKILVRIAIYTFRGKSSMKYLKAGMKGIKDGLLLRLGPENATYSYSFKKDKDNYSGIVRKVK